MIDYIESRLWNWADSYRRDKSGLGYPRQTTEHRLVVEGGVLIRGTGRRPEPVDEEADEMEAAIRSLNDGMQKLVKRRYKNREPAPTKAGKDKYYDDLHRLHVHLLEWLQDQ